MKTSVYELCFVENELLTFILYKMKETEVIVKCPKCQKKALFKSTWIGSYVLRPASEGYVSCTYCGHSGKYIFSKESYYYQIPIGDRILYARTINNLIAIKRFFENDMKTEELYLDFPKEFYVHKKLIIQKIAALLQQEENDN